MAAVPITTAGSLEPCRSWRDDRSTSASRDEPASDRDEPASDRDEPASDRDEPASDRDEPASGPAGRTDRGWRGE